MNEHDAVNLSFALRRISLRLVSIEVAIWLILIGKLLRFLFIVEYSGG